jgi:heme-degrading monooxygenase HmoA
MAAVIWFRYRVDPARSDGFERTYGPAGTWARFFDGAPGYLRTELQRSIDDPAVYLLADVWRSVEDHERFLAENSEEYTRRSREAEHLYLAEERLGRYVETSTAA